MEHFVQDIRLAFRLLLKGPGFTLVAVVCLGLGIGANTTLASVVNAVLLRPFPFADPDRIVAVHSTRLDEPGSRGRFSYPEFHDLQEQSRTLRELAAYDSRNLALSGEAEAERILGAAVSASLFPLLGEKPFLGRNFLPAEDRPGGPPVILLSHDLWTRRYGGDRGIVGRAVVVNGIPRTVVGVMPQGFRFPSQMLAWLPLGPTGEKQKREDRGLTLLARLGPGVSFRQAEAEAQAMAGRLAVAFPDSNRGRGARLLPLREELANDRIRRIVLTMMGAVVCVLLIACANVANLLLSRATVRRREIAVRAAFGAGWGRIVRQLLTESVLLSFAGAALGLLLGHFGIQWLEAAIPASNQAPYWMRFTIDGRVLSYIALVAMSTGILFGLAPALEAGKTDLTRSLREGGRGATGGGGVGGNRLRRGLVVAEITLALVLLVLAALFSKSFLALQDVDGGVRTAHRMTFRVYLAGDRYLKEGAKARWVEDAVQRLEAVPGVERVGVSNNIPLSGGGGEDSLVLEGKTFPPGKEPEVFFTGVTGHFFRALDVPLVTGRSFTDREVGERSRVALVNETFVRRFLAPGESAVGRQVGFKKELDGERFTIVGVVRDYSNENVNEPYRPSVYVPYPYQSYPSNGFVLYTTSAAPATVMADVRTALRAADPDVPIYNVYTLADLRQQGYWEYGLFSAMFGTFGLIALVLAATGVYGVLSYSVSQRVGEIGVRVAIGASRWDVLRLIVGQGVRLAVIGVVAGVAVGLVATRVVASFLFGVTAGDPASFAGIAILLTAVAAFASFQPASRAMAVDPLTALRSE